jgi:hypothetical protein
MNNGYPSQGHADQKRKGDEVRNFEPALCPQFSEGNRANRNACSAHKQENPKDERFGRGVMALDPRRADRSDAARMLLQVQSGILPPEPKQCGLFEPRDRGHGESHREAQKTDVQGQKIDSGQKSPERQQGQKHETDCRRR